VKLTFLGGVGTVTGSKYLLEYHHKKILVDCGLFQGEKELRLRNWDTFPVDPASIDAVLLTHAHLDHSGYLPLLVKQGFQGRIFCSPATLRLCQILLPDSGHIQEEDTRRANRYGYTKHHPALPLYTQEEAEYALRFFHTVGYNQPYTLDRDFTFVLERSGHILGSSFITLSAGGSKIVFSGDIGRLNDPVMSAPVFLQDADYIVVESTYGDRLHEGYNVATQFQTIINQTILRGGKIVIPAFAVGRAQEVLYHLSQLKAQKAIPDVPIFLDSPMAIDVTDLLCEYPKEHRLEADQCRDVCYTATYTPSVEESKAIEAEGPCIIISASGMATGGRVLHHLKNLLPDARNTIVFAGYQAKGTRGDRLMRGEKEIKIHGEMVPVNANIEQISGLSAHADYSEILSWLRHFKLAPKKIFVTHGEPEAATAMKDHIEQELGWNAIVPKYLQREELE
jgi:metallo-beta-lactamase family protein